MAKVTSKGQITIPISIRRRLEIEEGAKILFINRHEGVLMVNPDSIQSDMVELTANAVPLDAPVTAAAAIDDDTVTAAADVPEQVPTATVEVEAAPPPPPTPPPPAPQAEPQKRKYIDAIGEIEEKPAVGGIDLSSLLDDIRSIGSKI